MLMRRFLCILIAAVVAFKCQTAVAENNVLPDGAWRAALDPKLFLGENPFALENFPVQPSAEWKRFPSMELRRGQVFLDGKPLMQAAKREELLQAEHAFWVEPDGKAVQVRLAGGASPEGRSFELTCREQVFAPVQRGLNYIGVSGFRIFHAANAVPIPLPQRGALSATVGHHWIIEDCEIGYANTIGIDLGGQWWTQHARRVGSEGQRCQVRGTPVASEFRPRSHGTAGHSAGRRQAAELPTLRAGAGHPAGEGTVRPEVRPAGGLPNRL
jgi:hypothetical protein